jgi:alkanesulfonate monooxygenase SsuD/methylene tetrahydromethanopterin reductase-like flavin-dependent oxidoreductase (luciferase family)
MFGPFGDAQVLAELAKMAEDAGWDGFFIWDQITGFTENDTVTDCQVALAAMALNTQHIRFGALITPLARRRPQKYAREAMALDRLSGGRLVCGVGLGNSPEEFEDLGEPAGLANRAEMLDEALDVITGLWTGEVFNYSGKHYSVKNAAFKPTPLQTPRIPVWVAGVWPKVKAPFRRAARWDGVFPLWGGEPSGDMPAEEYRKLIDFIRAERKSDAPFDVIHTATTPDPAQAAEMLRPYTDAGVTWFLESVSPWSYGGIAEDRSWNVPPMRARIAAGPPKA